MTIPNERQQFSQVIRQQDQQYGINLPGSDGSYADAGQLAQMAGYVHQQQPGPLGRLFSGGGQGGSSLLENPMVKSALAGIVSMAGQHVLGGLTGNFGV